MESSIFDELKVRVCVSFPDFESFHASSCFPLIQITGVQVGANFNSKHNREHVRKFKAAAASSVHDQFRAGSRHVAESLDFFGSLGGAAGAAKEKGVKKNNRANENLKPKHKLPTATVSSEPTTNTATSTNQTTADADSSDSGSSGDDCRHEADSSRGDSSGNDGGNNSDYDSDSSGNDSSSSNDGGGGSDGNGGQQRGAGPLLFASPCNGKKITKGTGPGKTTSPKTQKAAERQRREEVNTFRKRMNIRVKGTDVNDPIATFSEMSPCGDAHIKRILLRNIERSLYKEPTPIQMQAIPLMLQRRDILAAAPTGSGKTCAFVLPVLASLAVPIKKRLQQGKEESNPSANVGGIVRAIIVAPTPHIFTTLTRHSPPRPE